MKWEEMKHIAEQQQKDLYSIMDPGVKKIKVKYLNQTCLACPTQYSGCSADGTMIYIRCRHGNLTVSYDNYDNIIFHHEFDDSIGYLAEDEVREYTASVLDWSEAEVKSMDTSEIYENGYSEWLEQLEVKKVPEEIEITINGTVHTVNSYIIGYSDIVDLSGLPYRYDYTCSYNNAHNPSKTKKKVCGTLIPGEYIVVQNGTQITIVHTGNA